MATELTPSTQGSKTEALITRLSVPKAQNNKRSIMLSGFSGAGKTYSALQMPGSILCIYTDKNRDTLSTIQNTRDDILEISIEEWGKDWVPLIRAIGNREIKVENIVVDSMDALITVGIDGIRRKVGGKLEFDHWEEVRVMSQQATFELTQACRPIGGKRDYNVVVTMHLQAQTGKQDELIKYEPAIQGGFRQKIEQYFDFVLLADKETKMVDGTNNKKVRKKHHFLRTVEPNLYYTCKARQEWPPKVKDLKEILSLLDKKS